jgi:streptogramin lyase
MKVIRSLLCLAVGAMALNVAVSSAVASPEGPVIAPAGSRGVTEFPVKAMRISNLTQGTDGNISYIGSPGGRLPNERILGRVGPNGQLGEEGGLSQYMPGWITGATDGAIWLPSVKEVSKGGFLEISLSRRDPNGSTAVIPGTVGTEAVAPAADGGVWFLQNEPDSTWYGPNSHLKIGHVTAAGAVTSFPFTEHEAGLHSIVEGHEGNAWFTEYFAGRIGRITPTGELKEFDLPAGSRPGSIAVDAEGNLWFSEQEVNQIGRITPTGVVSEFKLPLAVRPGALAVGADGRIWFTERPAYEEGPEIGNLGRITPSGRFTQVRLPDRESEPVDLISGSEGNIWYSAMGENTFCGGGGSCIMWEPKNPAIVGRVAPTPLKSAVVAGTGTVGSRGVWVPLACEGGDAWSHCRGRIAVKVGGRKVATAKYSLEADQAGQVLAPFVRGAKSPLRGAKKKGGLVSVIASSGGGTRRQVSLSRHRTE